MCLCVYARARVCGCVSRCVSVCITGERARIIPVAVAGWNRPYVSLSCPPSTDVSLPPWILINLPDLRVFFLLLLLLLLSVGCVVCLGDDCDGLLSFPLARAFIGQLLLLLIFLHFHSTHQIQRQASSTFFFKTTPETVQQIQSMRYLYLAGGFFLRNRLPRNSWSMDSQVCG